MIVIVSALLVAQIVPSIVLATSLFIVFHWIHLLNTYPGLILADGTYAIPFAILVLRAFFFSLPNELMDAARVDGASEWRTFRLVVIPLARSAVITVAVFAFLAGWGDFIFALTTLNGTGIQPITLGIYNYLGNYFDRLGRSDVCGSDRPGAGRNNAGGGAALYSAQRSHGGFGEGLAMRKSPLFIEPRGW